jgi:hypothetical protein
MRALVLALLLLAGSAASVQAQTITCTAWGDTTTCRGSDGSRATGTTWGDTTTWRFDPPLVPIPTGPVQFPSTSSDTYRCTTFGDTTTCRR